MIKILFRSNIKKYHTIHNSLIELNHVSSITIFQVEDINDNAPIFRPYSPVVRVREHSAPHIITTLEATDRDSGIFGQVRNKLPCLNQ